MAIPDLKRLTYRHNPHSAFDPNLPEEVEEAIAIGWLADSVPRTGQLNELQLEAIRFAHRTQRVDCGELGYHTCGLCCAAENSGDEPYLDRGEFAVIWADRVYILPRMAVHYIERHSYKPPQYFLDDLAAWWISTETPMN